MDGYIDYLFKDSASAYLDYHLKTGGMTKKNIEKFNSSLKRYSNIVELRKGESIEGSQCNS